MIRFIRKQINENNYIPPKNVIINNIISYYYTFIQLYKKLIIFKLM